MSLSITSQYSDSDVKEVSEYFRIKTKEVTLYKIINYKSLLWEQWENRSLKTRAVLPHKIRKEFGMLNVIHIGHEIRFRNDEDRMMFKIKYGDLTIE